MSDPSANDSSDSDTDAGGDDEASTAVTGDKVAHSTPSADGGESASPGTSVDPADSTATTVTTDTPSPDKTIDSPLRAIGVAFGLGVLAIFVLVVVATLASVGLSLVAALTGWQPPFAVQTMVPLGLSQIVAFVGLGLVYLRRRGFDTDDIVAYLGVRWPSPVGAVLAVVGPFVALTIALTFGSIVIRFVTEPAPNQGAQVALENPSIIPVMIVGMLLIVGPCEEFLFRGVIQSRARETFSAVPAIVLAAAVFAPVHIVSLAGGGLTAVLATISILFVPALFFGAVYEYTGNLVVVALMHGLYNSLILTVVYIAITYGPELEAAAESGALLF